MRPDIFVGICNNSKEDHMKTKEAFFTQFNVNKTLPKRSTFYRASAE